MKASPRDHQLKILIQGKELLELKRHTYAMTEAFGLDKKLEKHKGNRPITLYRWDLECLLDVIDVALQDPEEYPDKSAIEYQALKQLAARLHKEYDNSYGEE